MSITDAFPSAERIELEHLRGRVAELERKLNVLGAAAARVGAQNLALIDALADATRAMRLSGIPCGDRGCGSQACTMARRALEDFP